MRAVSAALTASDTISTKPKATTRPRLAIRARIRRDKVERRDWAFHTAFSDDCTSPNTPVVASRMATRPITVAQTPCMLSEALRIIACSASAVS